jgi:hypothetical protein
LIVLLLLEQFWSSRLGYPAMFGYDPFLITQFRGNFGPEQIIAVIADPDDPLPSIDIIDDPG